MPLVHNSTAVAFRKDVKGVQPSPFSQEFFYPVSVEGKDHLIFGRGGDSVGLDCVDESDLESQMVCAEIFEPLVRFKPGTTEIIPGLAERWEVSDDLKTWTFHLRPGVKFHDGTRSRRGRGGLQLPALVGQGEPVPRGAHGQLRDVGVLLRGVQGGVGARWRNS